MKYEKDYFNYLNNNNPVRKYLRKFYFRNIKNNITGKTIDFGCGIGRLLETLPKGSLGYEINPSAVEYCGLRNLNVRLYNPDIDDYNFSEINSGEYESFISVHVIEHLENAGCVMKKIFRSCSKKNIINLLFVVPGIKGYKSDCTHKTFIDCNYIKANDLDGLFGYTLFKYYFFPVNSEKFGKYFTHNELLLLFKKT